MRNLLYTALSISFIFFTIACDSETETTNNENNEENTTTPETTTNNGNASSSTDAADYTELESDMLLEEYVGQKIWVTGTLTKPENMNQHMIKDTPPFGDEEKNICIDFNDGEQTICYYTTLTVPNDDQAHKFYGSVDKMTGTGKEGDIHTEYYITLEKVE